MKWQHIRHNFFYTSVFYLAVSSLAETLRRNVPSTPHLNMWWFEELKWMPSYTGSTWVKYKNIETLHGSIYEPFILSLLKQTTKPLPTRCMYALDIYRHLRLGHLNHPPNAYPKHFSPCVGMNGCLEMAPSLSNMYHMKQKTHVFLLEIKQNPFPLPWDQLEWYIYQHVVGVY